MKIKNIDILNSVSGLNFLNQSNEIKFSTSRKIARNTEELNKELEKINKDLNELNKKYVVDNKITDIENFNKDRKELLEMEVEVNIIPIKSKDLDEVNIAPKDCMFDFMLED